MHILFPSTPTSSTPNTHLPLRAALTSVLAAALLAACGGGGGGGAPNQVATISGTATANVSSQTITSGGSLTVTDPDPGQASFTVPANLWGQYGYWNVNTTATPGVATWTYTLQLEKLPALAAGQTLTEKLQLGSSDGSATQVLTVTIAPPADTRVTSVPTPTYAAGSDELQVFNYLNTERAQCGFGKLAQDPLLDKAAAAHANYQIVNNVATHVEDPALPGFTGKMPIDRAKAAGFDAKVAGDIIAFYPSAMRSIRSLMTAPYHALYGVRGDISVGLASLHAPTVQPVVNHALTVLLATKSTSDYQRPLPGTLLTYPCAESTDLAPAFTENVNWQASAGSGRGGTPLVLVAPNNEVVSVTAARLSRPDGAEVPTSILSSAGDPQKILPPYGAFVIPPDDLLPFTQYRWEVQGTIGGVPFTRDFTFKTGAALSWAP